MPSINETVNDLCEYLPPVIEAVYQELQQPENADLLAAFKAIENEIWDMDEALRLRLQAIISKHDVRDTNVTFWETLWGAHRRIRQVSDKVENA